MIIVEGPDGAGKTTLIKQLENKSKLKVAPRAVNSEGVATLNIANYIQNHLSQGFQKRLFDRFGIISGPIYGAVRGMAPPNEVFLDRTWHFHMEALFLVNRPVIIYCLPPLPAIRANLLRDETSSVIVGQNLEAIYYMYQARAARDFALGIAGIYDYTAGAGLDMVMQRISLRLGEIGESPWL